MSKEKCLLFPYLLFSIVSTSCSTENNSDQQRIVGLDERVSVSKYNLDSSIGKLRWTLNVEEFNKNQENVEASSSAKAKGTQTSDFCTAFVSAKNVVTTALHCFPTMKINAKRGQRLSFVSASGKTYDLVAKSQNINADIANFTIAGQSPNPLPVGQPKDGQAAIVVSFDGDKNNLVQLSGIVTFKSMLDEVILHNMDTSPGSSGSPILQNGKVVGIHLGEYEKNNLASSISGKTNVSKLNYKKEFRVGGFKVGGVIGAAVDRAGKTLSDYDPTNSNSWWSRTDPRCIPLHSSPAYHQTNWGIYHSKAELAEFGIKNQNSCRVAFLTVAAAAYSRSGGLSGAALVQAI